MTGYGTERSRYYTQRKDSRTCRGDRPETKAKYIAKHRAARKRARREGKAIEVGE